MVGSISLPGPQLSSSASPTCACSRSVPSLLSVVFRIHVCTHVCNLAVRGAAAAAGRLGFVFGVFSSVRCGVESQLAMPISAPFIAGAVAVALPTALDRKRQEFLTAYFKEHAGQALRGRSVVLASAVSGSIMFGCVDSLLRYTGVRW